VGATAAATGVAVVAAAAAADAAAARAADALIAKTVLDSGLRVVTESLPQLRSVTLGAWVGSGGRDEQANEWGASHFLEHLLFKGTEERSARDIAEAIESVGGEMNAFTAHEQTVFYVRVPDVQFDVAFEVLADVLWSPVFRPDEVESERQVILEEIAMRDDTPDDIVHELFAAALYPGHPLGREVIGSEESISQMPRDRIAAYHGAHYAPSNVIVAAAGNIGHQDVVDRARARVPSHDGARPARPRVEPEEPEPRVVMQRDTEQSHVVVGMRALPNLDPDRYALMLVNQMLGGGMSSRLFQEVRESRGLAYSVYSYHASFDDTGFLAIYAGTAPERVAETLDVVDAEVARLVRDSLADEELAAAKGHIVGSLAMSLETSAARMRRIGRAEMTEGDIPSLDELVARVERVEAADVRRVIDRVFGATPRTLAVVGPHDPADFE
jgi:predicted Zn-dependent peptidase